ncbi:MAG TPA: T9SS type A sorting domain-containing protein [Bacteroidales bacterium]|nr:T9SS type A sorting domain-containing protein [Bacteroidales bacterium]
MVKKVTFILHFLLIILFFNYAKSQDTIVGWEFHTKSQQATFGIPANLTKIITRENTFLGSYQYGVGFAGSPDSCIYTTGWDAGANLKCWQIEFSTQGFDNVLISSKQRSSSTGPRDFRVEYSLDNINWYIVPNANITTADNWTTGVLQLIPLPNVCWDQPSVRLRWIMTSNTSVGGGTVGSSGTSRIDNILIVGNPLVIDTIAPYVSSITTINCDSIVITFSEPVEVSSAMDFNNYTFLSGTISIYDINVFNNIVAISLGVGLSPGVVDSIYISGINDLASNSMDSAQAFQLICNQDTISPYVVSVTVIDCDEIQIKFSEPVDTNIATNPANYIFGSGNASVSNVLINVFNDVVSLNLLPALPSGLNDSLYIYGIQDLAGNIMTGTQVFTVMCQIKECIVGWNFSDMDLIADVGIPINLTQEIKRELTYSGTPTFPTSQGSPAPSISTINWNNGTGIKFWGIDFASYVPVDPNDGNSYVYDSLKISSKQRSSDGGPQDFQLQYYDANAGTWVDVPNSTILVKNNWTSGVLTNIDLPQYCWGNPNVKLRWVVTSTTSAGGGTVASTGASNIDEIYVTGVKRFYIDTTRIIIPLIQKDGEIMIYPNPANDILNIIPSINANLNIDIYNINGSKVKSYKNINTQLSVDVSAFNSGLYLIYFYDINNQKVSIQKVIIK